MSRIIIFLDRNNTDSMIKPILTYDDNDKNIILRQCSLSLSTYSNSAKIDKVLEIKRSE